MCADMVNVQWSEHGTEQKCTALLEDISISGACLQLDSPIKLGTHLDIAYHNGHLAGSVCYCFFREIGYWIGVRFSPKSKWSRREFRPRHLLDLKKLLTKTSN